MLPRFKKEYEEFKELQGVRGVKWGLVK